MNQTELNRKIFNASAKGNINRVKKLIENGANLDHINSYGETPLFWATYYGNFDVVKYLTEHGANVNQTSNDGSTPLILAINKSRLEIVKELTEHGADWSTIKNHSIFEEIIKEHTNKLKSELSQNYLTLERSSPQTITAEGKVKSSLPKNLLLKTVYENPYQELCSSIDGKLPPIQLIALANILKLDYSIDITWRDLCNRIKNVLYLLL